MFIIHDPVMTLTYFMTMLNKIACISEWGKLLKCHLIGKMGMKWANGQNIYDLKKNKKNN